MARKYEMVIEGEEVESKLNLELSIGRSFESLKKSVSPLSANSKSSGIDMDIEENGTRSRVPSVFNGGDLLDPQRKRRRQEERKKREEKLQKKMDFGVGNGGSVNNYEVAWRQGSIDDKLLLEAQEIRCRVRDPEAKEEEACRSERTSKRGKENSGYGATEQIVNTATKQNQFLSLNSNTNPNFAAYVSSALPISPMQFPVHQIQYLPFTNGFGFPCMMPCWAPAQTPSVSPGDSLITDKYLFQPIACRPYRPIPIPYPSGSYSNFEARSDSEQNGRKGSGSSPGGTSSSAVSDYQSASVQGRSSSDEKGYYSPSTSNRSPTQVSQVSIAQGHSENGSSSPHMESAQGVEKEPTTRLVLNTPQHSSRNSEKAISANESVCVSNPMKSRDLDLKEYVSLTIPMNSQGHSENRSSSPHMESAQGAEKEPTTRPVLNPPQRSSRNSEEAISANESVCVKNPLNSTELDSKESVSLTIPMNSRGPIYPDEPMKLNESESKKSISIPMKLEEPISRSESINKDTISTDENSLPLGIEDKEVDKKPETHAPHLSDMPCVSTTGNGPNGKTVTGFLYRYTKSEVSIVCVCHGSSFSPAEFIKHAGGTDTTHPLRHIVVAPSSLR